ncbi:MAG: PAS domain S-box protein [Sideroxyarcus sp.]|nr:PAS domain S-box protein [Sideroxyarcus sp.]
MILVMAGLVITAGAAWWMARSEDAEARATLDGAVDIFFSRTQSRLRANTQLLHSLAGMTRLLGAHDGQVFASYLKELDIRVQYPGLAALGHIQGVAAAALPQFVARMRRAGHADYAVHPAAGDGVHWPLADIRPTDETRGLAGQGFDLAADPALRAMLETARDSGEVAGSSRIAAIFGAQAAPGFILVHPLYAGGALPEDVSARRRLISGFAFIVLDAADLMGDLAGQLPPGVAGRLLVDLPQRGSERTLFDSLPTAPRASIADARQEAISIGGELALLEAAQTRPAGGTTDRDRSILVLALGLLTTSLVGMILWLYATRSAWAEVRAKAMASSLRASEERYALAMEMTTDGIWECDLATGATEVSPRFETLLGHAVGSFEQEGVDPDDLIHPSDRYRQRELLAAHLQRHVPYVIELRMRHSDGHYVWVREHGRALRDDSGQAVRMIGSITDVSDLHAAMERFRDLSQVSSDWFWEQDEHYRFVSFSESMGQQGGITPSLVLGKTRWDAAVNADSPEMAAHRASVEAHEPFRDFEYGVCDEKGAVYWYSVNGRPLFDDSGRFAGYRGTSRDISARKRLEDELRVHRDNLSALVEAQTADIVSAKEEAEQASRSKSEFLANMSHELRTPMHAILSFARIGRDRAGSAPSDKLRDYFDRIQTSGERLLELVNDLLDLSKFEAGKMPIEFRVVDLAQLARDVVHDLEAMMEIHGLQLEFVVADCDTRIKGDALRLAQVVRNLVSNALKFSPEGGRLRVEFASDAIQAGRRAQDLGVMLPALRMTVADAGVGIPEDELETVFDKFYQSSTTRTGAGGTGLGLAICREIVEAHRGTIRARNLPGGGAAFDTILPKGTPA